VLFDLCLLVGLEVSMMLLGILEISVSYSCARVYIVSSRFSVHVLVVICI